MRSATLKRMTRVLPLEGETPVLRSSGSVVRSPPCVGNVYVYTLESMAREPVGMKSVANSKETVT
jgi:hypothetical protein